MPIKMNQDVRPPRDLCVWLSPTTVLRVTRVGTREPCAKGARRCAFFWPKGESVLENLCKRHSRPHEDYRRLIDSVLCIAGLDPSIYSCCWSQRAGCSCGCSPGMVIRPKVPSQSILPWDLHVDYAIEEVGVAKVIPSQKPKRKAVKS
jgi:hypothetical protein